MNCFQILYLCPSDTTGAAEAACVFPLWIAFRFYIFVLRTQLSNNSTNLSYGCELLSDFISLSFGHNRPKEWESEISVVNCFQILYLCPSDTTRFQPLVVSTGCELLSDFISLSFGHNVWLNAICIAQLWIAFRFYIFVLRTQLRLKRLAMSRVVNCFQILYLCPSDTTGIFERLIIPWLWIAFRFYIFVLRTQPLTSYTS